MALGIVIVPGLMVWISSHRSPRLASVPEAPIEPWRWPQQAADATPDYAAQADAFEAFFQSFWGEKWFQGAHVWKWYPSAPAGWRFAVDFTPQGKPPQQVIASWYRREVDPPSSDSQDVR